MPFATYPSLAGRVVLVTGGATGIGADIVRAFVRNDAHVAFLDIQAEPAADLIAELAGTGSAPRFLDCDITDISALKSAIEMVRKTLGPVGVLVNNAANDTRQATDTVTEKDWDAAQAVNLKHQFFASQAVRAHMQELGGGSIINFSSIAWRGGVDDLVSYAAAKAAIIGLTRGLARDFGTDNIRVNAIEPGAVITERQRRLWFTEKGAVEAVVKRQLLKRVLLGEEIARTVLFLAADDSAMITKQSIIVDAGLQ